MNGCMYRTADNQCEKFSDPVRNTLSWCVGDTPCEARKLSNGDRIRSMSDEELAEVISGLGDCDTCYLYHRRCSMNTSCKDAVLEWLRKEAD